MTIDKSQRSMLTFDLLLEMNFHQYIKTDFLRNHLPIELNFDMITSEGRGRKMYANGFAHITNMANMPIYNKTPLEIYYRTRKLITLGLGMYYLGYRAY